MLQWYIRLESEIEGRLRDLSSSYCEKRGSWSFESLRLKLHHICNSSHQTTSSWSCALSSENVSQSVWELLQPQHPNWFAGSNGVDCGKIRKWERRSETHDSQSTQEYRSPGQKQECRHFVLELSDWPFLAYQRRVDSAFDFPLHEVASSWTWLWTSYLTTFSLVRGRHQESETCCHSSSKCAGSGRW